MADRLVEVFPAANVVRLLAAPPHDADVVLTRSVAVLRALGRPQRAPGSVRAL